MYVVVLKLARPDAYIYAPFAFMMLPIQSWSMHSTDTETQWYSPILKPGMAVNQVVNQSITE